MSVYIFVSYQRDEELTSNQEHHTGTDETVIT